MNYYNMLLEYGLADNEVIMQQNRVKEMVESLKGIDADLDDFLEAFRSMQGE